MLWYDIVPIGLAQMRADMVAIGSVSKNSGKDALKEVAPLIVKQAQRNINSRTGNLRDSVGWTETKDGIRIYAGMYYAHFVEEGTVKQRAQYYMKRAIDKYVDGGKGNTGLAGQKIKERVYRDSRKRAIATSGAAVAAETGLLAPLLAGFSLLMMGFAGVMSRY